MEKALQRETSQFVIKYRRLSWAGHIARMEEGRSAFKNLTGMSSGKRHSGRPRRRWEDNIRMEVKEIGINTRSCVDSAQHIGEPLGMMH